MKKIKFDPKKVKSGDSLGTADPEFVNKMRHYMDMQRSIDETQKRLVIERAAVYSMMNDTWREAVGGENIATLHQRGLRAYVLLDNGKLLIGGKEINKEEVGVSYA